MKRQNISSGAPWESRVGYSRAVRIGQTIEVSGTVASDAEGKLIGTGDAYAQAMYIFQKIGTALSQAGAGLEDVIRTRVYLTRLEDWDAVGAAHAEVFGDIRPASTMLVISALVNPDMLVEIEASAVLP
ncbi:RidA family protein [Eisenibacter elegans]|uniref:RidA family protein n=1 Tax=Eisenibacter elegans TaxID=997 RepID=UPI00041B68CD|nr:RidA family protein [Eisenibacter elegans]